MSEHLPYITGDASPFMATGASTCAISPGPYNTLTLKGYKIDQIVALSDTSHLQFMEWDDAMDKSSCTSDTFAVCVIKIW